MKSQFQRVCGWICIGLVAGSAGAFLMSEPSIVWAQKEANPKPVPKGPAPGKRDAPPEAPGNVPKGPKPEAGPPKGKPAGKGEPAKGVVANDTPARKDLADFLIKPAETATSKRQYRRAVALWQGVVAIRGVGDESAWQLAQAWTLAGEYGEAIDELEAYRAAATDPARREAASKEIAALKGRTEGFERAPFRIDPATAEATKAFKLGRQAYGQKRYADAIALFKAGYAMAPDLPGNLRELGASYDKLGRTEEANDFFVRYLRMRPFTKNAAKIRERLRKAKLLGQLSVRSALPCDVVMMNREVVPKKLPVKKLEVAPGRYKLLCFNQRYHLAHYEEVRVEQGAHTDVEFAWAVLENKLRPWGRLTMEHPDPERRGQMVDLGLWDEIGVPVPVDRRALRLVMKSGDGTKTKELLIKLEPGKKVPLTW